MTIRNVNGRNVYVLEPRQPTGKTTSGRNWATLYSELRWQVWEEIQKNEAAMLKMELSSAQMRKDYYDDKIKVLQDQRKQLQAAALKAEKGQIGSANSDALRAAQGAERMARQTAGKTVTRQVIQKDMFGEPVIDPATNQPKTFSVTTETKPSGGVSAKAKQVYERILDDWLAGQATEEDVKDAAAAAGVSPTTGEPIAKPAGPTIDQQIEALDRDLEQLLLQRQAATSGLDADLLRRTREGFAEQVGVMGQGGGIFGLAPRPRRTMPFVQQGLAEERVQEFARGVEEEKALRGSLERQKADLLNRREEAMAVGGEMAGALILDVNRQLGEIEAQLSQPTRLETVLSSEEFTPRRAGELLLRDRPRTLRGEFEPPRMAGSPVESGGLPAAQVTTGEAAFEPLPEEAFVPGIEVMTPEERQAAEADVRSAGLPPTKPEGELPLVKEQRRPLPPLERAFLSEPEPAQLLSEGTPLPSGQPVALDEEQAITNPDILDNPDFIPSASLIEKAEDYYRGMTIKRGEDRSRKILAPKRYFGGETQMVKEYLKDQIREQAPVGVDIGEEIEAVEAGPPQTSTKQRKDRYKFDVVTEGTKLARTPKKLQRLAKTNLPEENRPEHYVIVDKLYDVNRGKAEAFKMTYDEISRAFQNDPQKRSDAHKYLVAKDILEADVSEPLA